MRLSKLSREKSLPVSGYCGSTCFDVFSMFLHLQLDTGTYNPLCQLAINLYDDDCDGKLDHKEIVQAITSISHALYSFDTFAQQYGDSSSAERAAAVAAIVSELEQLASSMGEPCVTSAVLEIWFRILDGAADAHTLGSEAAATVNRSKSAPRHTSFHLSAASSESFNSTSLRSFVTTQSRASPQKRRFSLIERPKARRSQSIARKGTVASMLPT
jgi:hypothetical protein